jgi:hypothetical protein
MIAYAFTKYEFFGAKSGEVENKLASLHTNEF